MVGIPPGLKAFDIDLCEADVEALIQEQLTTLEKVEVKHDFIVSRTGNVAIEFSYRGRPSGISTTKATHWLIILDGEYYKGDICILISVERLRQIARACNTIDGGDDNASAMYLVPVSKLLLRKAA